MNYSDKLKERLKKNAFKLVESGSHKGRERNTAFIFDDIKMNFHHKTWSNIKGNENWLKRSEKKHTHFSDGTFEMQSSNSSDALLMNIFCFPGFFNWSGPKKILKIDQCKDIQFGWNPEFENENKNHPTEIDLKIGDNIFEAKMTESSFTAKEKDVVYSYADFNKVFNDRNLVDGENSIKHYQLIRNVLTAYKYNYNFTVLLDESRIDLIRDFTEVLKAIKIIDLKQRINFVTWQELVHACGEELREYIIEKYF